MYIKKYTVKGDDVNDFMYMVNFAYISYTVSILHSFLFEKGYSREKLNGLKLGLQECSHQLIYHKNLMFNEIFSVEMELCNTNQKIIIKNIFYNSKNELCTEVIKELNWFDYSKGEVIAPPKKIIKNLVN